MVCMEAITAFMEGPGSWAVVYGILYRRPWRYVIQLAVSLGQLYGDMLYFATTFYDGQLPADDLTSHSFPTKSPSESCCGTRQHI